MSLISLTTEELARRLVRLEAQVRLLSESAAPARHYTVSEFAGRVGRTPYTVREWCRLGRIHAERKSTGCGPYREWVISQQELIRYQTEGLLPSSDAAIRRDT